MRICVNDVIVIVIVGVVVNVVVGDDVAICVICVYVVMMRVIDVGFDGDVVVSVVVAADVSDVIDVGVSGA